MGMELILASLRLGMMDGSRHLKLLDRLPMGSTQSCRSIVRWYVHPYPMFLDRS